MLAVDLENFAKGRMHLHFVAQSCELPDD